MTRPAFVVRRSTWIRGRLHMHNSSLLNTDGHRCCLGFAARDIGGVADSDCFDMPMLCAFNRPQYPLVPMHLSGLFQPAPDIASDVLARCQCDKLPHTTLETLIVARNDNHVDEHREADLIVLFDAAGVDVTFED